MACGVALKRSLDFDALHHPNSGTSSDDTFSSPTSKRRKYSIPQRCGSVTSVTSTPPSISPSFWRRYSSSQPVSSFSNQDADALSPFTAASKKCSLPSEEIVKNIYHEYKRLKKRKQLQLSRSPTSSSNRMSMGSSRPCDHVAGIPLPSITLDPKSHSSVLLASKQNVETPILSMKQVGIICERLLKEQEDRLRHEYEKALIEKLSEQYDAFVKFSHDQLRQQLEGRPASYVS